MTDEIWRDVIGYEGQYEASSFGRIRSLVAKTPGLIRKQDLRKDGYLQVQLKICQKYKNCLVHKLVDEAFNGPMPGGMVVNHKDGVKANNNVGNLERCTSSQNALHALASGLKTPARGATHGRSKLTEADVLEIREICKVRTPSGRLPWGVLAQLCARFGLGSSAMGAVIRGQHWKHIP